MESNIERLPDPDVEETHRAEVEAQVNSRHEARRHSAFPR
jgi:hypothetical protein